MPNPFPSRSGSSNCALPDPGEIHLWHIQLDEGPEALEDCRRVLDDVEKARAARFIRAVHGDRFIVGRGRLRMLLASYLKRLPEDLIFVYNEQGKPSIEGPGDVSPFSFNLSHSVGLALCAVAGFETVGVDVEACRETRDLMPIARRFFSADEQAQLSALPEDRQCAAFYQCWSSKEALLKAWGTGLATPLDRFTVRVAPGHAAVIAIDIPEWNRQPWQLYPVNVPCGYAAAVAVPGTPHRLRARHWPGLQEAEAGG